MSVYKKGWDTSTGLGRHVVFYPEDTISGCNYKIEILEDYFYREGIHSIIVVYVTPGYSEASFDEKLEKLFKDPRNPTQIELLSLSIETGIDLKILREGFLLFNKGVFDGK